MSLPVVDLSTYRERARWGAWDQSADLLPTVYARSIEAAGDGPILLLPTMPYEHTPSWRDDRDSWELALLAAGGAQSARVHARHLPDRPLPPSPVRAFVPRFHRSRMVR